MFIVPKCFLTDLELPAHTEKMFILAQIGRFAGNVNLYQREWFRYFKHEPLYNKDQTVKR